VSNTWWYSDRSGAVGPLLLFILLTFAGSCCAAGSQAGEAHDLALKSTGVLNDKAKRIPPLLKEIEDSGSAVINEIKKPGCHSDTFKPFQQNVVTSNDFADELERDRLKIIQLGDQIQDQIQPSDPPIADGDLVTWASNIDEFERHSKELLDVVHRTQRAVWEAALMRNCSDHAVDEYLSSKPDTFTFRKAVYSISKDPSRDNTYCLYRNKAKVFCHDDGYISFEQRTKTKDYDLVVMSLPEQGSGVRWWNWKLVVEDGKKATVKTLAKECLGCNIHVERLNFPSNEANFGYRQNGHQVTGRFSAGDLAIRRRRLDPNEPLDEETCDWLYESLASCKHNYPHDPNSSSACSIWGGSNSGHFAVLQVENDYAGISYDGLDAQCKRACSTGTAMDRTTFFKKVCRR
jgi:hypothetical protein